MFFSYWMWLHQPFTMQCPCPLGKTSPCKSKSSSSLVVFFPSLPDQAHSCYSQSICEDWLVGAWGLFLTCQHPSIPQLSAVPFSSWPGRLSLSVMGEGWWRWIRGVTKISLVLTTVWFGGHCHTMRVSVITAIFLHFKAFRQVWFRKHGILQLWVFCDDEVLCSRPIILFDCSS